VVNWVADATPVVCQGLGGRQVRTGPEFGNIFDHFAVRYEYENGLTMSAMATQQRGISTRVGILHDEEEAEDEEQVVDAEEDPPETVLPLVPLLPRRLHPLVQGVEKTPQRCLPGIPRPVDATGALHVPPEAGSGRDAGGSRQRRIRRSGDETGSGGCPRRSV
jgi:hypothetical protein